MWSQNPDRETVPVSSGEGPPPLPNARRTRAAFEGENASTKDREAYEKI